MQILILLVFVSSILAAVAVGFFAWSIRTRHHDHLDRLALAPLADDVGTVDEIEAGHE